MSDVFTNIADLTDPNDPGSRTYREINNTKIHKLKVGSLVEIIETGVRLFIVKLGRDCDGTPLYSLTPQKIGEGIPLHEWLWSGGYGEESLRVIRRSTSE